MHVSSKPVDFLPAIAISLQPEIFQGMLARHPMNHIVFFGAGAQLGTGATLCKSAA
jgi:hypothetical protein